ncbi:LOW QUALITY PROTEIN: uncharacterized protein LOC128256902 [Drosophila gunungcola]|uniref:LOW QUALITY PROTEIN: uncharacterized protein LOC128256902 n=1 Tax=Drosophila gunungcola TaxID=103775 RepID=UPI0022E3DA06|nr:LOW QUALITY PROTEIN: uncharacterized protein LOC128256902 [Drosophila gunungcola]
MSMWRSVATRTRSHLLPRFGGVVSQRGYAEDHNPSPKCNADTGKGCGKFTACGDPRFEKKPPPKQEDTFQFHHLVKQPPECCDDPCRDRFPLYDDCFYKISDKAKRKYQVTWVECPPIQIKPKKICCFEAATRPPIPRRKRKVFVADEKCPTEQVCPVAEGLCPRITMPGCKAVDSVSCHVVRRKTDCIKVKAPYPSFSECSRPPVRKARGIECRCLEVPSACDLVRETIRTEGNPRKGNCGGSRG